MTLDELAALQVGDQIRNPEDNMTATVVMVTPDGNVGYRWGAAPGTGPVWFLSPMGTLFRRFDAVKPGAADGQQNAT